MNDSLVARLDEIKKNAEQFQNNEEATKQWAILPVLECVGWNIRAIGEVVPEYAVGGGKVDYCLKHSGREQGFVEAKNPSRDLQQCQEQLLKYVFEAEADLAVLTNGLTWWFYLPHERGAWEKKRFFVVNLQEQETSSAAEHLEQFLGKASLLSGDAIKKAREVLRGRERGRLVEQTLPQAWEQLLNQPDESLCKPIADRTESICGHRPGTDEVVAFLKKLEHTVIPGPPGQTPPRPGRGKNDTLKKSLALIERHLLPLLREIVPSAELHFPPSGGYSYIGLVVNGRVNNAVFFVPKNQWTRLSVKVDARGPWITELKAAGMALTEGGRSDNRVIFRLTEDEVYKHKALLRKLFTAAYGSK